jgi:peptidoglycan/xylan/chitin deacetylase (PgdA/CDA1 family)
MRLPLTIRRAAGLALIAATLLGFGGSAVSATAATKAVVISHGPRTTRRVAITFDDGVSPANCRRILAILVQRDVPATFFPIADAMRADPAFWQLVVAVGDPIGDHTMTHPEMPTLTEAQQVDQIDQARRLAEATSGAPLLRVFRPPYGAYDSTTLLAAAQTGFPTVLLWDTSDRDTSREGTVAEMLHAAEAATNGSVILMHCGPDATPFVLGPLLDNLTERGLKPVTIPTLLGLPWTTTATGPKPTIAEILHGLSPLPPQASGGPIVGPSGIGTMTFPPLPSTPASPPVPVASPSATTAAPGSASSLPAPTVNPRPTATGSLGIAALATALPLASPPPSPSPDDRPLLTAGLAVLLLALGIIIVGVVRMRRRPSGG